MTSLFKMWDETDETLWVLQIWRWESWNQTPNGVMILYFSQQQFIKISSISIWSIKSHHPIISLPPPKTGETSPRPKPRILPAIFLGNVKWCDLHGLDHTKKNIPNLWIWCSPNFDCQQEPFRWHNQVHNQVLESLYSSSSPQMSVFTYVNNI